MYKLLKLAEYTLLGLMLFSVSVLLLSLDTKYMVELVMINATIVIAFILVHNLRIGYDYNKP